MDSRRSKKSRSIAIEPKSSRSIPAVPPQFADRTCSNPAIARRHTSQTQSHSQGQTHRKDDLRGSDARVLDVTDHASKTSVRDDPVSRPDQSNRSTRLAVEPRIAYGALSRNQDVCTPLTSRANAPRCAAMASFRIYGNAHADCLTSSRATMRIFLRSTSLCWEVVGSESQHSFEKGWTFVQNHQQHGQARRCPWTAWSMKSSCLK